MFRRINLDPLEQLDRQEARRLRKELRRRSNKQEKINDLPKQIPRSLSEGAHKAARTQR